MDSLRALLLNKRVIVCCGAGGVGKTTTAAAMGLAAAKEGRRVLVLTIDPAKRLAQAMGLSANSTVPITVSKELLAPFGAKGTLDAWMLNPAAVFETLVKKLARSPAQAEAILKSRLYQHLSELISGMQEYTAAEALHGFCTTGRYDLVVLDTPPARNALDFLEAPGKLARFLDERILNLFLPSTKTGFFKKATELIGTVFSKVFGNEFFSELQQFLSAFNGMFGPMRLHAEEVRSLLMSNDAAFVLVTSPEAAALADAQYFKLRMQALRLPFAGYVLNRSWAQVGLGDRVSGVSDELLQKLRGLEELEASRRHRDSALLVQLAQSIPHGFAVATAFSHEAQDDLFFLDRIGRSLALDPHQPT
jgi:anion-transporting  ArsA/GET3 family ATPase